MQTFKYKGLTAKGTETNGVIKAYNETEAVALLREQLAVITEVSEVQEQVGIGRDLIKKKIKEKELALICSQFSIILRSGLPVVKCVEMVAAQMKSKDMEAAIRRVGEDVSSGYTLAQGFENCGRNFPLTFIETIRAGEESGTLESCFARLKIYYEKSSRVKAKVISTLTYPAIVIFVAIIVFIIIMVFAVPLFTKTFETLGTELPFITRALIAFSHFLTNWWWFIALFALLCFGCYKIAMKTEKGRLAIAKFRISKSPLHKITAMSSASTFANTLCTMIAAGLPINRALAVTAAVIPNTVFSVAVDKVREDVEQGRGIADSMRPVEYFPKILTEMMSVGEQSGSMTETLDVVGEYLDNEVETATNRLLAVLEPALTVGIAVVTVVLLLAVYMPMFSMYGTMGV